jgi:hypothetical protein
MKTPKEYHYTYYSYEEWGRGYFGSRTCKCLPEEDVKYFGSSKDKTFKPKYKIILKDNYATREEAYADEIILQQYYKVVENPHFANRAYQTSTKFYVPKEQSKENGRIWGKVGGKITAELKIGVHGRSKEQIIEDGKKGGKISGKRTAELKIGVHSLTRQQNIENGIKGGKVGGKRAKKLGLGIHARTKEQHIEDGRKGGKIGGSKGGKIGGKISANQKWMCTETKFIANAGNLAKYQRARGIETSKRVRVS